MFPAVLRCQLRATHCTDVFRRDVLRNLAKPIEKRSACVRLQHRPIRGGPPLGLAALHPLDDLDPDQLERLLDHAAGEQHQCQSGRLNLCRIGLQHMALVIEF